MKKLFTKVSPLAFTMLLCTAAFGQVTQAPVGLLDPPPAEEICGTMHQHEHLMETDPMYALKHQLLAQYMSSYTPEKVGGQYRIPVVVHLVYYNSGLGTSVANVTDDQVREAVLNVNKRWRNYNTLGVDTDVEFVLAVRDPNGNCTTGITRDNAQTLMSASVYSNYSTNGVGSGGSGITDAQIKAINQWPSNQYFNIWLVTEINNNNGGSGVQGYAVFASAHGTTGDGSVMVANAFLDPTSTVFTHEMGHAFNLYHTFQGNGGCPSANGCADPGSPNTNGDCVSDTPPHMSSNSTCNASGTNSCDGNSSNSLFIYNYMDYSSCTDRFTVGQRTRIHAAITGPRGSFLAANGNTKLVPPIGAATATSMRVDKSSVCFGSPVQLFDATSCSPNDFLDQSTAFPGFVYSWTVTNASTSQVYTSDHQNPIFNNLPVGTYNVTFQLTHASYGTITSTTNAMFKVLASGTTASMCTPTSANVGLTGHTVSQVKFNTINNLTGVMSSSPSQNFICTQNTTVQIGSTYPLTVSICGQQYSEYVEVDIDWNNDGDFADASENAVLSGNVAAGASNTFTQNITIPASAVTGVLLRMRVMGEIMAAPSAGKQNCSQAYTVGDVEDYGIYVQPASSVPTVATQPSASTVCATSNASFTAAFNNSPTSYQWQLSTNSGGSWTNVTNGGVYSNATTTTLNITGAASGMNGYQYRCVGTNASGSVNSNAATLTVNNNVTPSFTQIAAFCAGTTAPTLPTTSSNSVPGTWSPATVSNTASGTYTFTPNAGQCATTATMNITVNPAPSVAITPAGSTTFCTGGSVVLNANTGSGLSYQWKQNGTNINGATSSSYTANTAGTYTVVVSNGSGCSTTSTTVTVTVNNNVTPLFTQVPAFCSGTTAPVLPSTSTNAVSGTWSPSTVSNSASGTYSFTPNAGQCATTTTMNITVNPTPSAPSISADGPTTFCQGESVVLTSSASSGNIWSNGGATTNTITVTSSGTYTVTQTVSGCTSPASAAVTVTVNASVTPTFNVIPAFCSGTTAPALPGSSTNGINGTWSPATVSNTASGTYTFIPAAGQCATNATIDVVVNPSPAVTFGSIPELCVYDGPITLTQGAPAGGTYSGNGVSGGQFNPATAGLGTSAITYNYTNGNGCSGSAQSSVLVDECLGISESDVATFSLYPNPSNGIVTIDGGSTMIQDVHVFNHLGQLVKEIKAINFTKQEVNLSNLANGVYTIRITTEHGIQSIPVVIEK